MQILRFAQDDNIVCLAALWQIFPDFGVFGAEDPGAEALKAAISD
jgi:hypothetical protein